MRYKLGLSFSAQNIFLCALTHFFSINDVTINRKKIKKFMSESENKYEYRSYTTEEIGRLLLTCNERERAIILILASTGMRTMWHFDRDSLTEYRGERFHLSWREGLKVFRIYSKRYR